MSNKLKELTPELAYSLGLSGLRGELIDSWIKNDSFGPAYLYSTTGVKTSIRHDMCYDELSYHQRCMSVCASKSIVNNYVLIKYGAVKGIGIDFMPDFIIPDGTVCELDIFKMLSKSRYVSAEVVRSGNKLAMIIHGGKTKHILTKEFKIVLEQLIILSGVSSDKVTYIGTSISFELIDDKYVKVSIV